ncbi:MAG: DUF2085 domain-containing protein [Candidatus Aminicenantales bacterium]
MQVHKKIVILHALTLGGISAWIGLVLLAPYLAKISSPWAGLVYSVFSPVCHQNPARCFWAFGFPLAVCARCFGIYSGFFLGVCVYPLVRGFSPPPLPHVRTLIFATAPIAIDTAGNILTLWSTPGLLRFFTGLLWGGALPFYFFAGMSDLILRRLSRPSVPKNRLKKRMKNT